MAVGRNRRSSPHTVSFVLSRLCQTAYRTDRKKLEPYVDLASITKVEAGLNLRNVEMPEDSQSTNQVMEVPPWAETEAYEISSTDIEGTSLLPSIFMLSV